jgi:hypothetical protein
MGKVRLPVRKIRKALRLKAEGFSDPRIAAAIGIALTVQECVRRARGAGVSLRCRPRLTRPALHANTYRRVAPLSRTPGE